MKIKENIYIKARKNNSSLWIIKSLKDFPVKVFELKDVCY